MRLARIGKEAEGPAGRMETAGRVHGGAAYDPCGVEPLHQANRRLRLLVRRIARHKRVVRAEVQEEADHEVS